MKNKPYFELPNLIARLFRKFSEKNGKSLRLNVKELQTAIENTEYYKETKNVRNRSGKSSGALYNRIKTIATQGSSYYSKINLTLEDLIILNELFEDEYNLTSIPILSNKLDLLNIFLLEEKIDLFLPSVWNEEVASRVTNIFHTRTFEVLQEAKRLPSLVKFNHVIRRGRDIKKYVKTDWYKSLHDKSYHVRLACSHSYFNPAVEVILAEKIFDVDPFKMISNRKKLKDNELLPFHTYFPYKKEHSGVAREQIRSSFHMPIATIKEYYPERVDEIKKKRCIFVNGEVYPSDNRKDFPKKLEHSNYGVLILRNCEPPAETQAISCLYGVIFATYAPVNLAIADRLLSGNFPVPFMLPRIKSVNEPHVLLVVVKVTISANKEILKKYDSPDSARSDEWRKISEIEIVDAVLSYKNGDTWEEKESLSKAKKKEAMMLSAEGKQSRITIYDQWYIKDLGRLNITDPTYPY